jgi:SAM-dependent methyltransferase
MKLISRIQNVVDHREDLLVLAKLDNFPIFMGCVEHQAEDDICSDMTWAISQSTGIIQLTELVPLDILYNTDHDAGVIGKVWLEHHQEFANFINKFKPKSILEIGGGHGILSREYRKIDYIDWTIVEPNPSPATDVDVDYIEGFFDDKFDFHRKVDTLVHSHVFEHVYFPDKFINDIASFLQEGQSLIFSLPNMEAMLKRNYTNCLNFEHSIFITEPYVEYFLSKNGFRLIEKQYFKKDSSIFYSYVKDTGTKLIKLPKNLYEHNKKLYLNYLQYHQNLISDINEKISKTKLQQPIYLFGAHIFSQSLIQFGLSTKRIVNLLDNDIKKQGRRLYGTNLTVESPKILTNVENPVIILKAGIYNNEIIEDILNNINPNAVFWS